MSKEDLLDEEIRLWLKEQGLEEEDTLELNPHMGRLLVEMSSCSTPYAWAKERKKARDEA